MPTHGALSKAGKVRSLNPRNTSKTSSKPNPRIRNRRKYVNRIVLGRNVGRIGTQGGQYEPSARRRR